MVVERAAQIQVQPNRHGRIAGAPDGVRGIPCQIERPAERIGSAVQQHPGRIGAPAGGEVGADEAGIGFRHLAVMGGEQPVVAARHVAERVGAKAGL